MRFMLNIACDNAAFDDPDEVSRILHRLVEQLANSHVMTIDADSGTVRDANGNPVGRWHFIDDENT